MRILGIDEAGYGPNLGPLVVVAVALDVPEDLDPHGDWWTTLADLFARTPAADRLLADDSKAVLARHGGLGELARTVRHLLPEAVWTLAGLVDAVGADGAALRNEHWHDAERPLPEDVHRADRSPARVADWTARADAAGVRVVGIRAAVLFPERFNARLASLGNKAAVELAEVAALLDWGLNLHAPDRASAVVDRLGGRKFYRGLLEGLDPGAFFARSALVAVCERSDRSDYRLPHADGRVWDFSFRTKADRDCLPVALASMAAKLLRECCMAGFNAHWRRLLPDLRPTAGYPSDAQRFRAQTEHLWPAVEQVWRSR